MADPAEALRAALVQAQQYAGHLAARLELTDGTLVRRPGYVLTVGTVVHGFAGGYFGRDSYGCRRVEALGTDWVVTRNEQGLVEAVTNIAPASLAEYISDFSNCDHGDAEGGS